MYRVHHFEYIPAIIGARRRYRLELPVHARPRPWRTMTNDMRAWAGEVLDVRDGRVRAIIRDDNNLVEVYGTMVGPILINGPCVVMEHLNINGRMSFMMGNENIMISNDNYVNYGIINGKHLRIDIYTGDWKVIE